MLRKVLSLRTSIPPDQGNPMITGKRVRGKKPLFSSSQIHQHAWEVAEQNGKPDIRAVVVKQLSNRLGTTGQTILNYLKKLEEEGRVYRADRTTWLVKDPSQHVNSDFRWVPSEMRNEWPLVGLGKIVGVSPAIAEIRRLIKIVASAEISRGVLVPVLITGDSGTGKELVAQQIHEQSFRSERMFHPINCAAIPTELLETKLFGHERGSFTGATAQRTGWFDAVDDGTIFLDEIGESEPAFQRKVLRVLENGEFTRVGGTKLIKSRARVLAATNCDLLRAIAEGKFRLDLYHRLNIFGIHLPPLSDRMEDVPHIFHSFLLEREHELGQKFTVSPKAVKLLMKYRWPGNVRELRNVALRAFILANDEDSKVLEPKHVMF